MQRVKSWTVLNPGPAPPQPPRVFPGDKVFRGAGPHLGLPGMSSHQLSHLQIIAMIPLLFYRFLDCFKKIFCFVMLTFIKAANFSNKLPVFFFPGIL